MKFALSSAEASHSGTLMTARMGKNVSRLGRGESKACWECLLFPSSHCSPCSRFLFHSCLLNRSLCRGASEVYYHMKKVSAQAEIQPRLKIPGWKNACIYNQILRPTWNIIIINLAVRTDCVFNVKHFYYFWKFSQPTSNIALVLKFLIAMQLQQNFTKGWRWLWFYPGPCILTLRYWNTVSLDQKITFLIKERKRTHLQAGFYGTPFMIWALQLRGDQINLAISLLPALHGRSDGPSYHLRHMLYKGWHISLYVQTTL